MDLAKKHGLEIFTVAAHLQGQALGDEPSAKTLQFVGGEAVEAYKAWRGKGNKPPRTDPYYVPDDVGKKIHEQATEDLRRRASAWPDISASCRIARCRCPASSARRPIAGAIGSCSRRCRPASAAMRFPTCARSAWSCWSSASVRSSTPARNTASTYDLECHPSERAMGDLESAGDYLKAMDKAGYAGVGRLQPRRLAHGMAGRLGRRSSSASSASASTAPTSRACR